MNLGNCPAVDIANNICMLNGQEVACNIIRECDGQTGAQHFEYALPEGNDNPNIWVYGGGDKWTWNGPGQPVTDHPDLPATVNPVFVPEADPIVMHAYDPLPPHPPVIQVDPPAQPYSPLVPPANPHPPVIQVDPPAQPILPVIRPEEPPPPGSWLFDRQPGVITPNLGPVSGSTGPMLQTADHPWMPFTLDDLTGGTFTSSAGDSGIPWWVILAAGGAAAYMLFGGKR